MSTPPALLHEHNGRRLLQVRMFGFYTGVFNLMHGKVDEVERCTCAQQLLSFYQSPTSGFMAPCEFGEGVSIIDRVTHEQHRKVVNGWGQHFKTIFRECFSKEQHKLRDIEREISNCKSFEFDGITRALAEMEDEKT